MDPAAPSAFSSRGGHTHLHCSGICSQPDDPSPLRLTFTPPHQLLPSITAAVSA